MVYLLFRYSTVLYEARSISPPNPTIVRVDRGGMGAGVGGGIGSETGWTQRV